MPVDAIYTGAGGGLCCMATGLGFGYGFNSKSTVTCPYGHEIRFIDNDYKRYDHARHLSVVTRHSPQYCTVKDVMALNELPQILDWAAELSQHARNVIIIPKCDCIDQIPEQYMIGYATPTSYGGTPLPASAYYGRRVHILGGAWAQIRSLLINSHLNVISLDFNHIHKQAVNGWFSDRVGYEFQLSHVIPDTKANPIWLCMAMSLTMIRTELHALETIRANAAR